MEHVKQGQDIAVHEDKSPREVLFEELSWMLDQMEAEPNFSGLAIDFIQEEKTAKILGIRLVAVSDVNGQLVRSIEY